MLLGAAVGAALGAAFGGRVDVTALALVVAEHVADRASEGGAELDEDELVRRFVRAWQAEPWRGYGMGTSRLFGLLHAGVPWTDAARVFAG